MNMRRASIARIISALAVVALPLSAQERAIAIRGGTVLPVSGPAIPNGTVVMRAGKIVAHTVTLTPATVAELDAATGWSVGYLAHLGA